MIWLMFLLIPPSPEAIQIQIAKDLKKEIAYCVEMTGLYLSEELRKNEIECHKFAITLLKDFLQHADITLQYDNMGKVVIRIKLNGWSYYIHYNKSKTHTEYSDTFRYIDVGWRSISNSM